MKTDEFRRVGYAVIDWIADYMENGYDGPVSPPVQPGELLKMLPEEPPQEGQDGSQVMEDFRRLVLPYSTHWNDPRFFAYFPCNHSPPGILGDLLSAGLGVNAMSWATCPAATEMEIRMMEWLGGMIGLDWPGCIQDTASTATLCALLAAREKVAPINGSGGSGQPPLTVYASDQTHSSAVKAVRIAGMGDENLRLLPVDDQFALLPEALDEAIEEDRRAGRIPVCAIATVGTTSSTAIDPVPDMAQICRRHGVWLHVDAALAGSAAIIPEMNWLMDGVAASDSYVFNPHKWLFTNFDCSAFFCKDPDCLKRALAIQPEYLKTKHDTAAENFRDWSVQLGRRFRALKLWFVIRSYGVEGLRAKIGSHLELTRWFAQRIRDHQRTRLLVEPRLQTVCFHLEDDPSTQALLEGVNATGEALLTHTRLNDRYIIRVSFGQLHQTQSHAEALWKLIEERL
ncbi:MAG TPA: aminotransferase class V-fold PLP-dependent enzyme [Acidobacteriota bacterium]|nr:aminotransferase class V-fold PLP-dependent enzyme [Acidobacteriota bacterium]